MKNKDKQKLNPLLFFLLFFLFVGIFLFTASKKKIFVNKEKNLNKNLLLEKENQSKKNQPTISPFLNSTLINTYIENGDIAIEIDGKKRKITNWGFNFNPVLSPNKAKIAYLSETKETQEYKKNPTGFIPASRNIWIIDIDGNNPRKITQHKDFVIRGHLHWLDDNRLLFTDGELTAKIYYYDKNLTKVLFGLEKPEQLCIGCGPLVGYRSHFLYSPGKRYFIKLVSQWFEGLNIEGLTIVDLSTLKVKIFPYIFTLCPSESINFSSDNYLNFTASLKPDINCREKKEVVIQLFDGKIIIKE